MKRFLHSLACRESHNNTTNNNSGELDGIRALGIENDLPRVAKL